jgi:hypothetical protein
MRSAAQTSNVTIEASGNISSTARFASGEPN